VEERRGEQDTRGEGGEERRAKRRGEERRHERGGGFSRTLSEASRRKRAFDPGNQPHTHPYDSASARKPLGLAVF
jgi:hypothetical protein